MPQPAQVLLHCQYDQVHSPYAPARTGLQPGARLAGAQAGQRSRDRCKLAGDFVSSIDGKRSRARGCVGIGRTIGTPSIDRSEGYAPAEGRKAMRAPLRRGCGIGTSVSRPPTLPVTAAPDRDHEPGNVRGASGKHATPARARFTVPCSAAQTPPGADATIPTVRPSGTGHRPSSEPPTTVFRRSS